MLVKWYGHHAVSHEELTRLKTLDQGMEHVYIAPHHEKDRRYLLAYTKILKGLTNIVICMYFSFLRERKRTRAVQEMLDDLDRQCKQKKSKSHTGSTSAKRRR